MNPLKPLICAVIGGITLSATVIAAAAPLAGMNQSAEPAVDGVKITKMPVDVQHRTFDARRPPPEMPRLKPPEAALCAAEFLSSASVSGQAVQTDAMRAKLTINRVEVTVHLNITVWLPPNPPRRIVEHEEGHRQIAEYFYDNADVIAKRLAEPYIGKVIEISGSDVRNALAAVLNETGEEITEAYKSQIPVERAEVRYDAITDHGRNDIPVPVAVAQAIRETALASSQPTSPAARK